MLTDAAYSVSKQVDYPPLETPHRGHAEVSNAFHQLLETYEQTRDPAVLEQLYRLADDMKLRDFTLELALQALNEIERRTPRLTPVARYRKAVLLTFFGRTSEALPILQQLLEDPARDSQLRDRAAGYLLRDYHFYLPGSDRLRLRAQLQASQDSGARQMLEDYRRLEIAPPVPTVAGDEAEAPDWFLTSEDYHHRPIPNQAAAETLRQGHRPEHYHLFLDQTRKEYWVRGNRATFSDRHLDALIVIAFRHNRCDLQTLAEVVLRRDFNANAKGERDGLHKIVERLKDKLEPLGVELQQLARFYFFAPGTSICLFYSRAWVEERDLYP